MPSRDRGTDRSSVRHFFAQIKAAPALIDLHIHLLPAIDDGCGDLDATVALARAAVEDGVSAVAATPHVNASYPTTPQAMLAALDATDAALRAAGIPLDVRPGAEIALDRVDELSDAELRAFSLGGSGRYVLLESPFAAWPIDIELRTGRLAQLGMRTVLAHPERCRGLQTDSGVEILRSAVDRGMLVQVNAGSLVGRFGKPSRTAAEAFMAAGLVHLLASDAHDAVNRPPRMTDVAKAVGDDELANWLAEAVPAAILAGADLPPRPERAKRQNRWWRRG